MNTQPTSRPSESSGPGHREKLLRQEVQPCDDPVCSCEAEPRWLQFQQENAHPGEASEWDVLSRSPSDEL